MKNLTNIISINGHLINHIMYADDLVLVSPSSAGLSQLLHECEKFGTRHDLKYNAKKSAVMIYRSMTLKGCTIPKWDNITCGCDITLQMTFLMMMISNRQRRTLFVQGKFYMFLGCEAHTLSYVLFTYVYSTTLVELQKSTITKLQISYHITL